MSKADLVCITTRRTFLAAIGATAVPSIAAAAALPTAVEPSLPSFLAAAISKVDHATKAFRAAHAAKMAARQCYDALAPAIPDELWWNGEFRKLGINGTSVSDIKGCYVDRRDADGQYLPAQRATTMELNFQIKHADKRTRRARRLRELSAIAHRYEEGIEHAANVSGIERALIDRNHAHCALGEALDDLIEAIPQADTPTHLVGVATAIASAECGDIPRDCRNDDGYAGGRVQHAALYLARRIAELTSSRA